MVADVPRQVSLRRFPGSNVLSNYVIITLYIIVLLFVLIYPNKIIHVRNHHYQYCT